MNNRSLITFFMLLLLAFTPHTALLHTAFADSYADGKCCTLRYENETFNLYLPCIRVLDSEEILSQECWSVVMEFDALSRTARVVEISDASIVNASSEFDQYFDMSEYLLHIPFLEYDGSLYGCTFLMNPDTTFVLDLSSIEAKGDDNGECASEADSEGGIDVTQLVETDDDILGISQTTIGPYTDAIDSGAKVVNLDDMSTFFVLWVPDGYEEMTSRRAMVIAHGHTGDAYRELDNELDFAREYGYAIVAIQWWTGEQMYSGEQFYEFMDVALNYMAWKYGTQLDKCALRGWSFGSEISFEVTYLDKINNTNYLALTISHDGWMRPDPSEMSVGQEFTQNLYDGVYGDDAFAGTHFYLYSGSERSEINNTAEVITRFGGTVEAKIIDPDAGHDGWYRHPQYHEDAIQIFFSLAP